MNKQIIATDQAPAAVGPYSQGVRLGDFVFTAGQLGIVPGTKDFAGPDIESQTRQALENVKAVLEASGSCLQHVVKVTVFLQDIEEFSRMNATSLSPRGKMDASHKFKPFCLATMTGPSHDCPLSSEYQRRCTKQPISRSM